MAGAYWRWGLMYTTLVGLCTKSSFCQFVEQFYVLDFIKVYSLVLYCMVVYGTLECSTTGSHMLCCCRFFLQIDKSCFGLSFSQHYSISQTEQRKNGDKRQKLKTGNLFG